MTANGQKPKTSNPPPAWGVGGIYEIKVGGLLDEHWGKWFEGMSLTRQENLAAGQDCTLIVGCIPDQPALHGLLAKIRDLNLTLVSLRNISQPGLCGDEEGFPD